MKVSSDFNQDVESSSFLVFNCFNKLNMDQKNGTFKVGIKGCKIIFSLLNLVHSVNM